MGSLAGLSILLSVKVHLFEGGSFPNAFQSLCLYSKTPFSKERWKLQEEQSSLGDPNQEQLMASTPRQVLVVEQVSGDGRQVENRSAWHKAGHRL